MYADCRYPIPFQGVKLSPNLLVTAEKPDLVIIDRMDIFFEYPKSNI